METGQSLVVIGESGSGKTLLTRILIGQLPSSLSMQGEVHYGSMSLERNSLKDWQQLRGSQLVYMSQNPMAMFNPFQTIQSHFWETMRSHSKISKSACLAKALASMKEVRLGEPEEILKKYPFELSGGQLQRICIARGLLLKPDILIFDEALSGLDPIVQGRLLRLLYDLWEKYQLTYLFISHDFKLSYALCHRILVMADGGIVDEIKDFELPIQAHHPVTKKLIGDMGHFS